MQMQVGALPPHLHLSLKTGLPPSSPTLISAEDGWQWTLNTPGQSLVSPHSSSSSYRDFPEGVPTQGPLPCVLGGPCPLWQQSQSPSNAPGPAPASHGLFPASYAPPHFERPPSLQ